MDYTKSKKFLFQKIKQQLFKWLEVEDDQFLSNEEICQFLRFLKRSADTFNLGGLDQISSLLLAKLQEREEKHWQKEELKNFLADLRRLTYEYELFQEKEKQTDYHRNDKIPLIQIIDDDVTMLILLKDALENNGWMVIANTSPDKAISQYYDVNPDCVIIDLNVPTKNGIEILEALQKHTSKLFVPKIIVSALDDREIRLNAFRSGADDFLTKPIDLEELTVRIERHLQRKQLFDQSVMLDELTQLYNRKFLKDIFQQNINELKRSGQIFSMAILDIDHFKKVNDQFGHLVGDKVLASFASFLKESTRHSDTVFRYGGEEFVILFPNTSLRRALEIVSRLLKIFSKRPFEANQKNFTITFSAGVHTILTREETLEMALDVADRALYRAKESGRARVESINELLHGNAKRKLFISVIDDDAIIRAMLNEILLSMVIDHYEVNVQVFENGPHFFESNRLSENGEHFLILDRVMPEMDGLEILQKVKQTSYDHNVLVLMLTGRKSEEDIAQALKYGADDYITKPFSITELQARIERLIHRMK